MPNYLTLWDRLFQAPIHIDQTRCVKVRNRNASCQRCAHACTTGCISYADNELVISPEKCIGCATCATVCPTDALYPKKPTDAELHEQSIAASRANGNHAVIACQKLLDAADGLYDADKVTGVACLGRVDESLLLHHAAAGADAVTLVQGDCDGCQNKRGFAVATNACASANLLFETWNAPLRVAVKKKLPSSVRAHDNAAYDQSRRAFFLDAREETRNAAAVVGQTVLEDTFDLRAPEPSRFVHVDERGTLPHGMSERRRLLAECLDVLEQRYGQPEDVMIDSRLWSEVVIDTDVCNGCRMCATFCPTGSNFKFSTKQGNVGVKHRVQQCANCGLCADICPTGALTYSDEVFALDVAHGVVERYVVPNQSAKHNQTDSIHRALRSQFKDGGVHVVEYGESKKS